MSISTTSTKDSYTGNNSDVTQYPITFKYLEESHVSVYFDGVLQQEGDSADYKMYGDGTTNTGSITTNIAQPSTVKVTIVLDVPFNQPVDLQETGVLSSSTLEEAYDRLNMQIRRVWRKAQGVLTFSTDEGNAGSQGTADNLLGFDGTGNLTEIPNSTFLSGTSGISDLTDVTITNPVTRETIEWDGSEWVNTLSGAIVTASDTAPVAPVAGDLWFDSATTQMFVYYVDADSSQWVSVSSSTTPIVTTSDVPPSSPIDGDLWLDTNSTQMFVYYTDTNSSQWVTVTAGSPTPSSDPVNVKDYGAVGDGVTDATTAIQNALNAGSKVYAPSGNYIISSTLQIPSDTLLYGDPNSTTITRKSGFTGTMVQSADFSTYTGTTDATAPYPRYFGLRDLVLDGRYMSDDFSTYENATGGNGVEIYAHKIELDGVQIKNQGGVGLWCESSTGSGDLDLDYPKYAKLSVDIQATKYEGLIWKGASDQVIERVFCTNAGALIDSEQTAGTITSSPTYGGTNGGYTDGVVFDTGAEISFIHSWGHYSGRGIVINDGRINAHMLMAETCRYGGVRILGGYGEIQNLEIHRTGGYNSDSQPCLDFDAPLDDGVGWDIGGKIYQKDSANTTARNLVELNSAGRGLRMNIDLAGDNVAGHGVVIDGSYNYLDLNVNARNITGTAPDANDSSAIYRTASFSTRQFKCVGSFVNCDVVFRSSGTPDTELLDLHYDLNTGQLAFTGDDRTNLGQDWRFSGTVNGVYIGSENMGASVAFDSSITTLQTITIPHKLIGQPKLGRYQVTGISDTATALTDGVVAFATATSADATNVYAEVKMSTANSSNTSPRLTWTAKF